MDYPLALLDSGVARSHIQQQSCVCLVLSEPEKHLVVEGTTYATSSTEIRIGNDIWKQTRLDIPFDSVRLKGVLVSQDPNTMGQVRLEKTWVQSVVQNDRVRHRVVFRAFTEDQSLKIRSKSPFGSEIEVSVNGMQATVSSPSENGDELLVGLNVPRFSDQLGSSTDKSAKSENQSPLVIELFYWEQLSGSFWQVLNMLSWKSWAREIRARRYFGKS